MPSSPFPKLPQKYQYEGGEIEPMERRLYEFGLSEGNIEPTG
jgi:hypothetical protein